MASYFRWTKFEPKLNLEAEWIVFRVCRTETSFTAYLPLLINLEYLSVTISICRESRDQLNEVLVSIVAYTFNETAP